MQAEHLGGIMPIEQVAFGPFHWSKDAFINEITNPQAFYYTLLELPATGENAEPPTVLGYGGCWVVCNEGHITTLAVEPTRKGQSLGELMLTHLYGVAYTQQAEWLTLEVRGSNLTAQNLYYKYGFRLAGRRPRYYQDNQEDALLLTTPGLVTEVQQAVFNSQWNALQQRFKQQNITVLGHCLQPLNTTIESVSNHDDA
jgi:ribosomal-protein-alanine acetyltransferase